MTLWIASAEIISILFMLIILGSLRNKAEGNEKRQKLFFMITLCTIAGLFSDASSYILDSRQSSFLTLTVVNILTFSIIHIVIALFSVYMVMMIRQAKDLSPLRSCTLSGCSPP